MSSGAASSRAVLAEAVTGDEVTGEAGVAARLRDHLGDTAHAIGTLDDHTAAVAAIGRQLAVALAGDGRLLAAGNGGSAAHAQHLTSELVGRFRDERRPFSALALAADPSAVTALVNDYGAEEVFARQVRAHARVADVLVLFSTSGRSPNLLRAAAEAHRIGARTVAFTGPRPNALAAACDAAVAVDGRTAAAVQEAHQVLVHLVCVAVERTLGLGR